VTGLLLPDIGPAAPQAAFLLTAYALAPGKVDPQNPENTPGYKGGEVAFYVAQLPAGSGHRYQLQNL